MSGQCSPAEDAGGGARKQCLVLCTTETKVLGEWVAEVCRTDPKLLLKDTALICDDESAFPHHVEGLIAPQRSDRGLPYAKWYGCVLVIAVFWDGMCEASKLTFLKLRQLSETLPANGEGETATPHVSTLIVQALNAKSGAHSLMEKQSALVKSLQKKIESPEACNLSSPTAGVALKRPGASESPSAQCEPPSHASGAPRGPSENAVGTSVTVAYHVDPCGKEPSKAPAIDEGSSSGAPGAAMAQQMPGGEELSEEALLKKVDDGQGECFQLIASDTKVGYEASVALLESMATGSLSCGLQPLLPAPREIVNDHGKLIAMEYLVRREAVNRHIELRIAMCGNVDSGKSTLTSVLTRGCRDDGRGLARAFIFNHKHELDTGRTSSVSENHLGFDSMGNVVNYAHRECVTTSAGAPSTLEAAQTEGKGGSAALATVRQRQLPPQELSSRSAKIVTLYDLAGHEKYLKTTVLGMTRNMPDYACIVISANNGIQRMTKEHLALCLALKLPFFIVVTRIDATPDPVRKEVLANITKLMKMQMVRKLPYPVRKVDDVIVCAKNLRHDRIAPLFEVSNVQGTGIAELLQLINLLPVRKDWREMRALPAELVIDSTFFVAGVGTVVGGVVAQGSFRPNDTVLIGPDGLGAYRPVQIRSIHVKGVEVDEVEAGNDTAICLKKVKRSAIRKGNILASMLHPPKAFWQFEAEITILYHSTTITINYEPVIHSTTVRQAARIMYVAQTVLRTGDRSLVRFHFLYRPEFMKLGQRLIFREGRTKGIGMVTKLQEEFDNEGLRESKQRKRQLTQRLSAN